MMPTRWLTARTDGPFIFESWTVNTVAGVISAMLFSVTLTILLESVNFGLHLRATRLKKPTKAARITAHVISTAMRVLALLLAYLIMLAIMSFNVWMLVCVVLGSGVGHQVVRPLLGLLVETRNERRRGTCGSRGKVRAKEEAGLISELGEKTEVFGVTTEEDANCNSKLIQTCTPHVHVTLRIAEAHKLDI